MADGENSIYNQTLRKDGMGVCKEEQEVSVTSAQ